MRLVFEEQGWEDDISWLKTDRKMLARINRLIEDVRRDPKGSKPSGGFGNKLLAAW